MEDDVATKRVSSRKVYPHPALSHTNEVKEWVRVHFNGMNSHTHSGDGVVASINREMMRATWRHCILTQQSIAATPMGISKNITGKMKHIRRRMGSDDVTATENVFLVHEGVTHGVMCVYRIINKTFFDGNTYSIACSNLADLKERTEEDNTTYIGVVSNSGEIIPMHGHIVYDV